jgi:AAHS family 4-hydroxybenzoate transporter-like MFS transporter
MNNLSSPRERTSFDIASVLDHGPWQSLQKRALILISLVGVVDGVDAQVLSLSLPMITKDWGVARADFAVLMALSFIAMAVGTALGGLAGDRLGRKPTLIFATAVFGAFTFAGAFSHSILTLGILRGIASLGLGAAMPNAATLTAEFTPLKQRNMALGICMSALPVGGILLGFLGAYLLPVYGWQTLFMVAGSLPLLLAILLMGFLPESLRFLFRAHGDTTRVRRLAARMGATVSPDVEIIDTGEHAAKKRAPLSAVVAGEFARDTYLLCIAFFFVVLSTYLVYTWFPSLFTDLGFSPKSIGTSLSCFSAGGLVGGVLGARLVQRVGSRVALVGMSLAGSACAIVILLLAQAPGHGTTFPMLVTLFFAGVLIPGTQAVIYVLAGQMYPTSIRATGVGLSAGVGRLGAVTSAFIGPLLLASRGAAFFGTLAVAMLVVAGALFAVRHRVNRRAAALATGT